MELWKSELDKLNKSGRTWAKSTDYFPSRYAELFCEECGKSLGKFDIVTTNLETYMYCANCVEKYIKDTPIILSCGVVREDYGTSITLEYNGNYYEKMIVSKVCYFNKKGRYIKVKNKRYYL